MWMTICGRHLRVSQALREQVHRCIGRVLARHRLPVGPIQVRLKDLNGPRGGIDKACQVDLVLPAHGHFVIEARDEDLYVAIARAGHRLKQALSRRKPRVPRSPHRSSTRETAS